MTTSPLHVRLNDAAGTRTFRALAQITGHNHETVRRYMQGAAPSVEFVSAFCQNLGLNANWLLTGHGPMNASDIRGDALALANPSELLGATAGALEKLDDRVARLEIFVSTIETRLRAAVSPEEATTHDDTSPDRDPADRARRIADAIPERPPQDDP